MSIAILCTGDELVHGDTLNTNGKNIAHTLSFEGLSLGLHLTCSDKRAEIVQSLTFLMQHHEVLIITGGLGPTTDDLTRFALADLTKEPLVTHQEAYHHVYNRLTAANIALNPGNKQQCLFPQSAKLLPNPHGTAMGCYYSWKNKTFILLPGPPRECLPMFHEHVIPLLTSLEHSKKQIIKWRIYGVAESEIADTLERALADLDCQTGYRIDTPYIEFKVRCEPEWVNKIKAIVDPILSPHIISPLDKKASEQLRELIMTLPDPIRIRDEATGGLLQSTLTRPETFKALDFCSPKEDGFFFQVSGLQEYWLKQKPGLTELVIHYRYQNQEGTETHTIPYRSASVVLYACEWLCFRLVHLINQLHQGIG